MILEGDVSVKAALLGKKRRVNKVYLDVRRKDRNAGFILRTCAEAGVETMRISREEIDRMASGRTHGGLIADADARLYDDL